MKRTTPLSEYLGATKAKARDVARRAGLPEYTVSKLKNGEREPTLKQAVAIEQATDGAVPASSWVHAEPPESAA